MPILLILYSLLISSFMFCSDNGWHCVKTYRNWNLLLQRFLRPIQCIVNCSTKGTHIDSGSGRTPHINNIQYTIRAVAIRSIFCSSGNMCGYGDNRSVGKNGCGCRYKSYASGGHINRSKKQGNTRSFTPWEWWFSLVKCCGERALMDISAVILPLSFLETIFQCINCRWL